MSDEIGQIEGAMMAVLDKGLSCFDGSDHRITE
jgi:hypothetical protein